jgi:hypothetical protein
VLVTKVGIAGLYIVIHVANNLIFPTLFAATAMGICNFFASFASIFAPMAVELIAKGSIKIMLASVLISLVLALFVQESDHKKKEEKPEEKEKEK